MKNNSPLRDGLRDGLKLVIFDCDGVLVDSERLASEATADFVQSLGLPMSAEEAHTAFLGFSSKQVVKMLEEKLGRPLAPEMVQARDKAIEDRMRQTPPPVLQGIPELLRALEEREVPMRVGSNSTMGEMDFKFATTGLDHFFNSTNIHSASDMGEPKPSPAVYEAAAKAAGVSPAQCVVIEDSDTGAEAAWRAGMSCILLRPEAQPLPAWWPRPHFVRVTQPLEALPLILAHLAPYATNRKLGA